MTDTALVRTEREGPVLVITLQREAKRNAMNRALADALDAALNHLDDEPELRVGVLSGGATCFSAGSDLSAIGDYVTVRGGEYGIIRRRRRKPLVAAVEGFALGGGLEIVLACDLVVAAEDARFGLPEVARGVLPTCGGLFRTLHALPANVARELVLTGEPMGAARAHAVGLVNRLAPPGQALDAARTLAHHVAGHAPLAVQASLGTINSLLGAADALGWELTARALEAIQGSEDLQEGIRAFFERRAPTWKGR
jgi:enoyl-CoA hydratase/carnithine racemase